jgi:hypothetical protein
MKEIYLKLIIVLSLLFSGCEEKDKIPYDRISDEIKDWIFYKTDSYWIYQDSASLQTDSIVIESSYIKKKYHEQSMPKFDANYYYDELLINYNKINYYSLLKEYMSSGSCLSRVYNGGINYCFFDLDHQELGLVIGCYNSDGDEESSTTLLTYYDAYFVHYNVKFNDVMEIKIEDHIRQCINYYFLAKHMGIIKKKVVIDTTTQTWNLIRWNIEQ